MEGRAETLGCANGQAGGMVWAWPASLAPPPEEWVSGVQGTEMGGAQEPARGASRPPAINHPARLYNYLGT